MIKVDKCCFCADLEKGFLVVAALSILGNIRGFTGGVILIILSLIGIAINILPFVAFKTRKAIYALAWVVGNPLLILIVTIYTIVVVIMIANTVDESHRAAVLAAGLSVPLIALPFQVYFWIVGFSYYKFLEEEEAGGAPSTKATPTTGDAGHENDVKV